MLEERTGRPVLGTLPFLYDVWLDGEDALAISGWSGWWGTLGRVRHWSDTFRCGGSVPQSLQRHRC